MTPRLQATRTAGKPWSLSPGATGGHRCPDTLVQYIGPATSVSGQRFNGVGAQPRTPSAPHSESRWMSSRGLCYELPDAHGHDAIMNVVDSVGKRAHFIPTNTTITAFGAAVYPRTVWK